jgi:hypothetical protein
VEETNKKKKKMGKKGETMIHTVQYHASATAA